MNDKINTFIDLIQSGRYLDFEIGQSMIMLLNCLNLDWIIDKSYISYDYLKILVNNNVSIYYCLFTGELERISICV